jgi:hypothetical protein
MQSGTIFMQSGTIFSKRQGGERELDEIKEVGVLPDGINCEVKEESPRTLIQDDRDSKKKSSSNDQDNTGIDKSSNKKVPDRNHKQLVILLPITGMLISFASLGIGMNAGYKADSPVVWGPLGFSIVCMLTLVGLCNSKASNSIKPQAVRELNPAISSKGLGPY